MAIKVNYNPAWLSWVASTTTCLRYHGLNVDEVDVAGHSGYAFRMVVARDVCPSGPTCFNWQELNIGIQNLGRSTRSEIGLWNDKDPAQAELLEAGRRDLLAFVRKEISAGRPCVIWGTYVPEFGVVTGVENDSYVVSTFREMTGEEQPPIPWNELHDLGDVYGLSFPHETRMDSQLRDTLALENAARLLNTADMHGNHRINDGAYDNWISALLDNTANSFGNAYNASCWAEQKQLASDFLYRLARRMPDAAGNLEEAAGHMHEVQAYMQQVAELFPFPAGSAVETEEGRREGVRLLELAQQREVSVALAVAHAAREQNAAMLERAAAADAANAS
ncbi:MAG: hypothetical protein R3F46_13290 [bacterium]